MEDIYKIVFDTSGYNRSAICRLVCIIKFSPKYYKGECRQYRVDNKEDVADNGELDNTTKLNNEEGEEIIYKELN